MTKYKKCMDCPFFENRCYVNPESVVSVCNKYHCCTSPESTCLTHKKHNHHNYDPELTDDYKLREEDIDEMHYLDLKASSAGRKQQSGADSPPFVRHADVNGSRHQPKTQEGPHFVMPPVSRMDPTFLCHLPRSR